MGKLVTIYDNGQRYEIDSDLIYVPWFVSEKRDKEENKNDTVSIPPTG